MEDELSLLDEINAKIPAADFQAEYYPGDMVRITMAITAEMAGQIKALAGQKGWPEADAYVAMLASGIGALKEARTRELLGEDSEPARDELDLLVKQMRQMETQYAVMKFRTWNFLQAYQASAMSQGALVNRANGLSLVVNRLRAENDELRERLRQVETANADRQPGSTPHEPRDPANAGGHQPRSGRSYRWLLQKVFAPRH